MPCTTSDRFLMRTSVTSQCEPVLMIESQGQKKNHWLVAQTTVLWQHTKLLFSEPVRVRSSLPNIAKMLAHLSLACNISKLHLPETSSLRQVPTWHQQQFHIYTQVNVNACFERPLVSVFTHRLSLGKFQIQLAFNTRIFIYFIKSGTVCCKSPSPPSPILISTGSCV